MAYVTNVMPESWSAIDKRFREFGGVRGTIHIPTNEFNISILLQPGFFSMDTRDSEIREAMYSMAEDAIAVAEQYYVLLDGPEVTVKGGHGTYLEGYLYLHFRKFRDYDKRVAP